MSKARPLSSTVSILKPLSFKITTSTTTQRDLSFSNLPPSILAFTGKEVLELKPKPQTPVESRLLNHKPSFNIVTTSTNCSRAKFWVLPFPMEVFVRGVHDWVTESRLTQALAEVLHETPFTPSTAPPLNFHLSLYKDNRSAEGGHRGIGALTFAEADIGELFLELYGDKSPDREEIWIEDCRIKFHPSGKTARQDIIETINRRPFVDPSIAAEKETLDALLRERHVLVKIVQFGWWCRDQTFSIEWEYNTIWSDFPLQFDDNRRDLRIELLHHVEKWDKTEADKYHICVRFGQITKLLVDDGTSAQPTITFTLETPPSFEEAYEAGDLRDRLAFLPMNDHERVSPHASLAMRLVCRTHHALDDFCELADKVNLRYYTGPGYPVERRNLFSQEAVKSIQEWLQLAPWCIAFQVEGIIHAGFANLKEILALLPSIDQLSAKKSARHTAEVLRYFCNDAKDYFRSPDGGAMSVVDFFAETKRRFQDLASKTPALDVSDTSLYEAYHVIITPTGRELEGPFIERSNRVIRRYGPAHYESFLRVSFLEEGRLQFRFDREIDAPHFIRENVGHYLLNGLTIAGRKFDFLAYSQSALREHSVWFVKPFKDPVHGHVNAPTIIKSLGSFDNLKFDPKLMYCPARYGARISQAFTATDVSVSVQDVEEIFYLDDIKDEDELHCFTDGVGIISRELADEIANGLRRRRRYKLNRAWPRAFQVRFMGSKGMLSVDYKLKGRAIGLRPSMIKFESPESREIEIARAFDKPGRYFLNRPLIMMLEDLGVPYKAFKKYQDQAVASAWTSTDSLENASAVLEAHGLGTSFRLPSVLQSLQRLGIENMQDPFYSNMIKYAVHHVLRELKNHARIPIPNAWTLVGVADTHEYLEEGEVFACIKPIDGGTIYLEGPVVISRSPTIHPGDIQIAQAIGEPPEDSCFKKEPLANTIVFSVLGNRPLPSCLGGGDLDGDEYNVIPLSALPEFEPKKTWRPAKYPPAERKMLDHPSTMGDVAEFVMEYINSDIVGIVASNWLIIADQSEDGIMDEKCLELARLHSDAVDYPKSGNPVDPEKIPRLRFNIRPDWSAPETINPDPRKYYPSKRAIGQLFRGIDLSTAPRPSRIPGPRWTTTAEDKELDLGSLKRLEGESLEIYQKVKARVSQFIHRKAFDTGVPTDIINAMGSLFKRYVAELSSLCSTCTLSHTRNGSLSEEEALIGTIIQKTSQPRKRRDAISRFREGTETLVRGIRGHLEGDEDGPLQDFLWRSWAAWLVSLHHNDTFGGHSFGWIALGGIFEAIRQLETEATGYGRIR